MVSLLDWPTKLRRHPWPGLLSRPHSHCLFNCLLRLCHVGGSMATVEIRVESPANGSCLWGFKNWNQTEDLSISFLFWSRTMQARQPRAAMFPVVWGKLRKKQGISQRIRSEVWRQEPTAALESVSGCSFVNSTLLLLRFCYSFRNFYFLLKMVRVVFWSPTAKPNQKDSKCHPRSPVWAELCILLGAFLRPAQPTAIWPCPDSLGITPSCYVSCPGHSLFTHCSFLVHIGSSRNLLKILQLELGMMVHVYNPCTQSKRITVWG
jgi:hypothetical protein